MSSGQGSGRSEGKSTWIFTWAKWLSTPIFFFQGAIREAGGSFGKKEKAEEDQYFRRQEREQLEKMKKVEADEKANKKHDGKKWHCYSLYVTSYFCLYF